MLLASILVVVTIVVNPFGLPRELIDPPDTPTLQPISPLIDIDGSVTLNWNAPDRATEYRVYMNGVFIARVYSTSYIKSGLTDGEYVFRIVAQNSGGSSEYSNPEFVTVELDLPDPIDAPILKTIIPSTSIDGIINLNWNDVSGADRYIVYRSDDGWSTIGFTKSNIYESCYEDTIETDGVYSYKVKAGNVVVYSDFSNAETVTVEIPVVPDSPTLYEITYELIDYGVEISVTWSEVDCDNYYLYKSVDGGVYNIIYPIIEVNYYDDLVYIDGTYSYKVKAGNNAGTSDFSNEQSVTVQLLGVPDDPILSVIIPALSSDGLIRLEWNCVISADRYYVYRAKNGGAFDPLIEVFNQVYYDDVIEVGGTYMYKVKAGNDAGISGFSNDQSVTVQLLDVPEPPIMNELTYTTVSGVTTIQLSWSDVDCESYNVYRKINDGNYILIANVFSIGYSEALTEVGVYFYRVSATNICGESEMSDFTSIAIREDEEPIVRKQEEPPTDYTMTYILLVVLGVLAVPVVIILVKKKKR